jgi:hypothetical protein
MKNLVVLLFFVGGIFTLTNSLKPVVLIMLEAVVLLL